MEKECKGHPLSVLLDEVPPRGAFYIRGHLTKARSAGEKVAIDKAWWHAVRTARTTGLPLLPKEVEVAVALAEARGFKHPPESQARAGSTLEVEAYVGPVMPQRTSPSGWQSRKGPCG